MTQPPKPMGHIPDIGTLCGGYSHPSSQIDYQITPQNILVPKTGILEIVLTPLPSFGEGMKIVIIHLSSYLYEILNPTGRDGTETQIYGYYTKNDVIKFRIALREEKNPKTNFLYAKVFPYASGVMSVHTGDIQSTEQTEQVLWATFFQNGNTTHLLEAQTDWAKKPRMTRLVVLTEREAENEDIRQRAIMFREECQKFKHLSVDPDLTSQKNDIKSNGVSENCYPLKSEKSTTENPKSIKHEEPGNRSPTSYKSQKFTQSERSDSRKTETTVSKSTKSQKSGISTRTVSEKSQPRSKNLDDDNDERKPEATNQKKKKKNPCCVIS